jgi:hypothetical protein
MARTLAGVVPVKAPPPIAVLWFRRRRRLGDP